jgi:hypothetical protein
MSSLFARHKLYYMSLLGGIAGLTAWTIGIWLPHLWKHAQQGHAVLECVHFAVIAVTMVGFFAAFFQYQVGRKIGSLRFLAALAGGLMAGLLSYYVMVKSRAQFSASAYVWIFTLSWAVNGAFIGLFTGIIRYGLRILRITLSMLGGFIGGAIGAAVLLLCGSYLPYLAHSAGLVFTGSGIALCSAVIVESRVRGRLKYEDSEQQAVRHDLANGGGPGVWPLLSTDRLLLGNKDKPGRYSNPDVYVHIPDIFLQKNHLWIVGTKGEFYLRAHNDNVDPSGRFMNIAVWDDGAGRYIEIQKEAKLTHGMRIKVGQTYLRFLLKD